MNLKFHVSKLSCVYMPLGTWAEVKVHSYHALTHMCVGSCMPCLGYSRCRNHINLVRLHSSYKGGGVWCCTEKWLVGKVWRSQNGCRAIAGG